MSVVGTIAPGVTIYTVAFRRWTGEFSEDYNSSKAGDYYIKKVEAHIQRYRYMAQKIVQELKDRKVIVFVTDINGDNHRIDYAKFSSRFSTGKNRKDTNGYIWTFIGVDRKVGFYPDATYSNPTGDEYTPPPADERPPDPAPDPTLPPGTGGCCVTIIRTPIPETPTEEGNILYLNKFVTVAGTGAKYFIDRDGKSILLGGATMTKERIDGTGASTYTLSETFDPEKCIVNRTQNMLYRVNGTPTEIDTFDIVGGDLILPTDWPLEVLEYIEIYQIK